MQAFNKLAGRGRLPWEDVDSPAYEGLMESLGKMKRGVLSMLHRDPTMRAKLSDVCSEWDAIYQA